MAKLSWLTGRRPEPYYLSFPSFGINRALGGRGLQSGRIHVYWGVKASGKTTAALQQIAVAQREGKICAFIDSEKAYNEAWAAKNGVDVDALRYIDTVKAEEALELLLPDLESGEIDVVVVDSLSSINFEAYFKPDANPMGSYARSSKMFTHKVLGALQHNQHAIFISHAAMDLSGYHPTLKAAVGNAIDHWCSTMIKFQKMNGKDHIRDDGSFRVKWRIDKSKQSSYPVEGEYWFNPRTAQIDTVGEVVTAAVDTGIISKAGPWFYLDKGTDNELKFQGEAKLVDFLKENPLNFAEIADRLNDIKVEAIEEDGEEG